MHTITRRIDESVRIGDDIVITIIRRHGRQVRIGVRAPSAVPVIRGELREGALRDQAPIPLNTPEAGDE